MVLTWEACPSLRTLEFGPGQHVGGRPLEQMAGVHVPQKQVDQEAQRAAWCTMGLQDRLVVCRASHPVEQWLAWAISGFHALLELNLHQEGSAASRASQEARRGSPGWSVQFVSGRVRGVWSCARVG